MAAPVPDPWAEWRTWYQTDSEAPLESSSPPTATTEEQDASGNRDGVPGGGLDDDGGGGPLLLTRAPILLFSISHGNALPGESMGTGAGAGGLVRSRRLIAVQTGGTLVPTGLKNVQGSGEPPGRLGMKKMDMDSEVSLVDKIVARSRGGPLRDRARLRRGRRHRQRRGHRLLPPLLMQRRSRPRDPRRS